MITAIVYTLVFVLAFPSLGYAECAWVLSQERPALSRHFTLNDFSAGVFKSQRECDAVADVKNRAEAMPRSEEAKRRLPQARWLCLPNTVDPRGAEGGRAIKVR